MAHSADMPQLLLPWLPYGNHSWEKEIKLRLWKGRKQIHNQDKAQDMGREANFIFSNQCWVLYGNHSVEKEIKLWLWKYRNISTIKKKCFSWKRKQRLLFPNYAGYISLMIAFWTVLAGPMGDQLVLFCQMVFFNETILLYSNRFQLFLMIHLYIIPRPRLQIVKQQWY